MACMQPDPTVRPPFAKLVADLTALLAAAEAGTLQASNVAPCPPVAWHTALGARPLVMVPYAYHHDQDPPCDALAPAALRHKPCRVASAARRGVCHLPAMGQRRRRRLRRPGTGWVCARRLLRRHLRTDPPLAVVSAAASGGVTQLVAAGPPVPQRPLSFLVQLKICELTRSAVRAAGRHSTLQMG